MRTPKLMAVLAHPDDESLGVGGTLAKYASEGVEVFLLTATRGEGGRYRGQRADDPQHPGPVALAKIREEELRAAASVLGVREVSLLDYHDQQLDRATPREAVASIVGHLRRVRPDVVVTFGPDGAYGHPITWRLPVPPQRQRLSGGPRLTRRRRAAGGPQRCRSCTTSRADRRLSAYRQLRTLFCTVDGVTEATPWPDGRHSRDGTRTSGHGMAAVSATVAGPAYAR